MEKMTKPILFLVLVFLFFSLLVNFVAAVTPVVDGDKVVSDFPASTYSYVVYGHTDPATKGVTVVVDKGGIFETKTTTDNKGNWTCKLSGSYPALKDCTIKIAIGEEEVEYKLTSSLPENLTGVGGIVVPFDKIGLLAPYIGLASATLIALTATIIYVKRFKHKKQKQ